MSAGTVSASSWVVNPNGSRFTLRQASSLVASVSASAFSAKSVSTPSSRTDAHRYARWSGRSGGHRSAVLKLSGSKLAIMTTTLHMTTS